MHNIKLPAKFNPTMVCQYLVTQVISYELEDLSMFNVFMDCCQ